MVIRKNGTQRYIGGKNALDRSAVGHQLMLVLSTKSQVLSMAD